MKKTNYIFFFTVGLILLIMLFKIFGVKEPFQQIVQLGLINFFLIVAIYLPNHILMTLGWRVLITHPVKLKNYMTLLLARIAGDATTSINTLASAAGEPLKALYIKEIIPFRVGLASVVLDRTIHSLSNVFLILAGIFIGFFVLDFPLYAMIIVFVLFSLLLYFLLHLMRKQKDGFLHYLIHRLPSPIARKITAGNRLEKINALDQEIKLIFSSRDTLHHFYVSLVLHTVPTLISGVCEIYLILYFLGQKLPLIDVAFVYLFGLFIATVIFFIPMNMGTSEGSYSLALQVLGHDPVYGVAIGMIRRFRTLVWAGCGMLLLFHAGIKINTTGTKEK